MASQWLPNPRSTGALPSVLGKELSTMKPVKIVAGLAIAGGLAAGALGVGAGLADADPGPGLGPVPTDWRPPPPPVPLPGGWNGGWEPYGGVCLFNLCI
jgi:hypothetical protein